MKIILNNIELAPINVIGGRKNVHGANRDTLTFVFPADMDMAELDSIFSAKNCKSITVEDEAGTYVHKGYTVRGELSKAVVRTEDETEESPAVYEERINVLMGQRTYTEKQMEETQAQIAALLTGEE
jgi:hypothetical protein